MSGKIFGIPLVLIVLVLAITLLVNVPAVLLHQSSQIKLVTIEEKLDAIYSEQIKIEPTATPEAKLLPTATPTVKAVIKKVIIPVTPTPAQ